MPVPNHLETLFVPGRAEWRRWLSENHQVSPGVWLAICRKGGNQTCLSYDEAVEEALCFGWIDSKLNPLDQDRYLLVFSPRRPKSPWSHLNKQRIEKLIGSGLMAPAGLEKIEAAKRDGSWTLIDAIEDLQLPADLETAFSADPAARQNFMAFSASARKQILWWIESARRTETRLKRIKETVELAGKNLKPGQDRRG